MAHMGLEPYIGASPQNITQLISAPDETPGALIFREPAPPQSRITMSGCQFSSGEFGDAKRYWKTVVAAIRRHP